MGGGPLIAAAPILRLRGVCKDFASPAGPVSVLRGVDVDVDAGEFVVLSGPSGSGKTTFLNLAALLDVPTRGCLEFDGRNTAAMPEQDLCLLRRDHVGMVFQQFHLLPHRTVLQNVLFRFRYLDATPRESAASAREVLKAVGLEDAADRRARLLSGGEKQRAAIARAVVRRPRLLLADEPTGNLDPSAGEGVMETLAAIHREGICVVVVSHNERWLKYATRHWVCRDGHIREVPP